MLKNRLTYQKLLKLKNSQTGKNGKISPTNFTRLSKKPPYTLIPVYLIAINTII